MRVRPDARVLFTVSQALFFCMGCLLTSNGFTGQKAPANPEILDLSLDELINVKVTTVSRKAERIKDLPAAVFVITQDDISRSSANSIPELLRMAPGLSVARIDANKWSVTSRGYSGRFADDLLVMIDGRTVYSPLFAGTFWETLDLLWRISNASKSFAVLLERSGEPMPPMVLYIF